eukprot:1893352-Amphidinium_carterae.1
MSQQVLVVGVNDNTGIGCIFGSHMERREGTFTCWCQNLSMASRHILLLYLVFWQEVALGLGPVPVSCIQPSLSPMCTQAARQAAFSCNGH